MAFSTSAGILDSFPSSFHHITYLYFIGGGITFYSRPLYGLLAVTCFTHSSPTKVVRVTCFEHRQRWSNGLTPRYGCSAASNSPSDALMGSAVPHVALSSPHGRRIFRRFPNLRRMRWLSFRQELFNYYQSIVGGLESCFDNLDRILAGRAQTTSVVA